jgi:hypothetical protein
MTVEPVQPMRERGKALINECPTRLIQLQYAHFPDEYIAGKN